MIGRRRMAPTGYGRRKAPGWGMRRPLALGSFAAVMAVASAIAIAQALSPGALSALIRAAKAGIPAAQCELGSDYFFAQDGLLKSDVQAVHWYEKAAAQGYAPAENDLGFMYHNGKGGLPKSQLQAVHWYEKAAAQGYASAENNLGVMYHNGKGGLPKSELQAVHWYEKAAAQGVASSETALGTAYYDGLGGLSRNPIQAVRLWEKAAAQGYKPAIARLRRFQHSQQVAVASAAPQPAPALTAPSLDHQRVVRSLQSFWSLYFRASNAQVVDFGAPALVSPVSFGSGS